MKKRLFSWLLTLVIAIPFAWAEDISVAANTAEDETNIASFTEASEITSYDETEAHAEMIENRGTASTEGDSAAELSAEDKAALEANLSAVFENGGTLDLLNSTLELPDSAKGESCYMVNYYYDGIAPADDIVITNGKIASSGALIRLSLPDKKITFKNVTFDNIGFIIPNGEYTFKNCTFTHCYYNCIKLTGAGTCNCYDTTFIDCSPDKEEFLYQLMLPEHDIRGLLYCQISHEASGATLRLKDCLFKNLGGTNVIHSSCDDPDDSALRLEIDGCVFRDTWGTAIGLSASGSNGWIKNCKFERLGSLRCRDGWEDKESYGNLYAETHGYTTGTTDYYGETVYYCGVGCNAIYNCYRSDNKRSSLIIDGNIIKNVVENGIEGCFESVCNNFIENTGYRVSEQIYTPSMEGMYVEAKTVEGNVIVNPARGFNGIVIARSSWHIEEDDTPTVIKDNTILYNLQGNDVLNDVTGIKFSPREAQYYEDNECATIIENNFIAGFQAKYDLSNYNSMRCKCIIRDDGINLGNAKLIDNTGSSRLTGVDLDSVSSRSGLEKNGKFDVWLDGEPVDWRTDHCETKLMQQDGQYHLYLKQESGSPYCAALSTYLDLPSVTGFLKIEMEAMSTSGMCGIVAKSATINNSDSMPDNVDTDTEMTDTQYDTLLCGVDKFKTVVTTIPVFGRTRISLLNICTNTKGTGTDDVIRIRNPRFTWIQNGSYCETGSCGDEEVEITDVSVINTDCGLDGTEEIPYLVNDNTAIRIWSTDPSDGNGEYIDFGMQNLDTALWYLQSYENYIGGKMTLLSDVTVSKSVYESWSGTLDLCGHTYSSDKKFALYVGYTECGQPDKTLHITDSSAEKTGRIQATNGNAILVDSWANLCIEDGVTIEASENGILVSGEASTVTIRSCTVNHGADQKGLVLENRDSEIIFDAEGDGFDIDNFQLLRGKLTLRKDTKLENKRYQEGSEDYSEETADYGVVTDLKSLTTTFNSEDYHVVGTVSSNFLQEDLSAHSDFSSVNVYQEASLYEDVNLNSAYYYAYNEPDVLTRVDVLDNVEDYTGSNWYAGTALMDIDWRGYSFTNVCQSYGFLLNGIESIIFRDTVGGSAVSCLVGTAVKLRGSTKFELYNCKLQGDEHGVTLDQNTNEFIMHSGEIYCSGTDTYNHAISTDSGKIEILSGTVRSDNGCSVYIGSSDGTLKLVSGDFYGKVYNEGTTTIAPEIGKTLTFNDGCRFANTPTTTDNTSITLNGSEVSVNDILDTDGVVVITLKNA